MLLDWKNNVVKDQRTYKQIRCLSLRFMGSGVTQYLRPARSLSYSQNSQGPMLSTASRPLLNGFRDFSLVPHGFTWLFLGVKIPLSGNMAIEQVHLSLTTRSTTCIR